MIYDIVYRMKVVLLTDAWYLLSGKAFCQFSANVPSSHLLPEYVKIKQYGTLIHLFFT